MIETKMKKVAIITARGGSKRIPQKNIKEFLGKPIIAYSIKAALNSKLFDEVMVSTDSLDIARIAKESGAVVPFMRSEKTSDDFATTADVLIEVIDNYKKIGKDFDLLCCIYPTAPFVTQKKLKDSLSLMLEKKADSVMPIIKFSYPIQRALRNTENSHIEYFWPENGNKRSQDLEKSYHDAGQFYWIKTDVLLSYKSLVAKNTIGFEISELEAQDIDEESDWKLAEIKYQLLNK